jgi:hypothetical protein
MASTATKFVTPVGTVQVSLVVKVSVTRKDCEPPPPAPAEVCRSVLLSVTLVALVTGAVAVSV